MNLRSRREESLQIRLTDSQPRPPVPVPAPTLIRMPSSTPNDTQPPNNRCLWNGNRILCITVSRLYHCITRTVYPQTENLICYYGDQLARSRPGALHSVALANRHLGVEPYVRAKTVVMGLPRVEIESFLLPTTCGCWCQVHADALIRRCK